MQRTSTSSARKATRSGRPIRRQRSRRTLWIALAVVAVVLVAGALLVTQSGALDQPGTEVPIQSREHIAQGATHPAYNSDPPTGGWHYAEPAKAGFYDQPIVDETVVHNLEHGHVAISYDCSKLPNCDTLKAQLRDVVNAYKGWKIIAVPRQNADTPLALTAWGRIEKLPGFDRAKIDAFVKAYRDHGPEQTME